MALADELQVAVGLMQAQRADEARKILKHYTKRHGKDAEGWFMLGQVARALQHWPEAIDALQKAQSLQPQSLAVTEFLAMTRVFSNDGRQALVAIEEFTSLLRALPEAPQAPAFAANLQTLALRADKPDAVLQAVEPYLQGRVVAGPEQQRLLAGLAIASFVRDRLESGAVYATQAQELRHFAYDAQGNALAGDYPFYHIYATFVSTLIAFRAQHAALYEGAVVGTLHAIGESHSLTPSQLVIHGRRVQSHLLMGAKAFMLASEKGESWQYQFKRIVQGLPKDEPVVAMFGEIDCRADEGIMAQWAQRTDYAMETEVAALAAAYVKFVKLAQLKRVAPSFVYGVPAPHRAAERDLPAGRSGGDFTRMIRHFNACLAAEAATQALGFLDVYASTVGSDGWAKEGVHIDKVHLTPAVVAELLARSTA